MKSSIKVIKERQPKSELLINALKWVPLLCSISGCVGGKKWHGLCGLCVITIPALWGEPEWASKHTWLHMASYGERVGSEFKTSFCFNNLMPRNNNFVQKNDYWSYDWSKSRTSQAIWQLEGELPKNIYVHSFLKYTWQVCAASYNELKLINWNRWLEWQNEVTKRTDILLHLGQAVLSPPTTW